MKSNTSLSDDFSATELGMQWQFFKKYDPDRYVLRNGQLILQAEGSSFDNSSPLLVNAADRKYQFQVEYTIEGNATAGLCLFYNEQGNMRISANAKEFTVFNQKASKNRRKNEFGNHAFLRILNDENEVSFYYSRDGLSWEKLERTIDASGFNHNVFGGFMSLRAGIFAFGEGRVIFDNFIYKKL
jgi:beta-xylosidase